MKYLRKSICLLSALLLLGLIKSPVLAAEYVSDNNTIISDIIRPALVNRESTFNVQYMSENSESYYSDKYDKGIAQYLFSNEVYAHTGNPVEGDYLRWQVSDWSADTVCEYNAETEMYMYDITYNVSYYTDASQEAAVSAAVDAFNSQYMKDASVDDYEKVQIIYDYICNNVSYDNSADSNNYTCYGALINKKAACQGYSLLFYRLALENGLDARLVASLTHGWNIVKVDGSYYNVDATWDAGKSIDTYEWFLKCNRSFESKQEHLRLSEYNTSLFNSSYAMSDQDYDMGFNEAPIRPGALPDPDAVPDGIEILSFNMAQILRLTYLTRPDYSKIIEELPDSVEVVLTDGSKKILPLEWECLGGYESIPQYFYYEFDINTDALPYKLNKKAILPYAGIFIGSGNVTVDSVTGRTNETLIANFLFTELDCNNATVAGILANIYSESGFNPTASVLDTNNKISYGICQWNGGRFDSLRSYCENRGMDYSSLHGQLNYLKHELLNVSPYNSRWFNEIKSSDNSSDAAYTVGYQWAARFEVCATRYREGRARLARDTYWPEYSSYSLNGLIKLSDGTIALFENGVRNRSYNGLYNDRVMGWKYLQGGCVNFDFNGLIYDNNLGWRKIAGGTIDTGFNDMFYSPSLGWWKVKNGTIDFDYNDLYYSPTQGWVKVAFGTLDLGYSDLYCSPTVGWWKVENGYVDLNYSDLYYSPTYGWWKINGGTIDFTYTDLYCSPTLGWWKVVGGVPDFGYNDLYCSPTLGWWKVVGGTIDFTYTDLYCSPTLGWWKVNCGTLDLTYTELYFSPTLGWWKINGGTIDFGYNDLYCSMTYGWWKIVGGTIDLAYNDLYCSPTYGWWKIVGGTIDFACNDIYKSPLYGWWKINGGTIDFTYTGPFPSRSYGTWNIKNGMVLFK